MNVLGASDRPPDPDRRPGGGRRGFSLFGVIIVLAVVAILAGALVPMAFRQIAEARERATLEEMEDLARALGDFYADTGRFPGDAEALAALVVDPGVAGWRGPYLPGDGEDPTRSATTDAWGQSYVYDAGPTLAPLDSAAVIVVSGGRDRTVTTGGVDGVWTTDGTDDDLQKAVSTDAIFRELIDVSRRRMDELGDAARDYFRDRGAFPSAVADLGDHYLDMGIGGEVLRDAWHRAFLVMTDNVADPPTMVITSRGPDGVDAGGAADDLALVVSSVAPGRRATLHELGIIQSVLDADGDLVLTGNWTVDRGNLNLDPFLDDDGWGTPYGVSVGTRTILSAGPDADYETPQDNIPPGVVPDAGGASDAIQYVPDTATVYGGGCRRLRFDITNTSDANVRVTSFTLNWDTPTAYFDRIEVDGEDAFESEEPRIGSGQTANLNRPFNLRPGEQATIDIYEFRQRSDGGGSVDISDVGMTVECSDGSTVIFGTGPC